MKENEQIQQIDVMRLLLHVLQKWWLLMMAAILVGSCTYFYTSKFVTPQYRASVTIYVNNTRSDNKTDYVSSANLSASQMLVATYVNIIQSDSVLEEVISATHLDNSADDLRGMMTASQVQDTEMFQVHISNPDAEKAATIANAIAAVAPRRISEYVEGSSTKIIDYAKIPSAPYTPKVLQNTAIGAVAGMMVMALIVALVYHFDARLKEERDVTELTDLPILGRIPEFAVLEEQAAAIERIRERQREEEKAKQEAEKRQQEAKTASVGKKEGKR